MVTSLTSLTAAKSLLTNKLPYDTLIELLPVAIYTCDKNGSITFFNKAAATLWGREPEIGKDLWCGSWKIWRPDGITPYPLDECPMAVTLRTGLKVEDEEIIVERPDGIRINVLPHPQPTFDEEGVMNGAVNMLIDITDQKIAEEQTAKLAAIVQSSEDAIIGKTLTGIVTSWNPAAERLFGYTSEEMIGQSITRLIPRELSDEEPQILERLKRGERVEHFETKRVTKNGQHIDISLTISPIRDSKGKVIGASKIGRDITEIKKLEQRKDDFIKMASHELKTPITSIKGYVQLLLTIHDELNDHKLELNKPTVRLSLNSISNQVTKLTRLVSELLDLSRVESGKLEMQKTMFDLQGLIDEIIADAKYITNRHTIVSKNNYEGSIFGDRDRISQVLLNLLTNAIKYSPDNSEIEISTTNDFDSVTVSVKDQGIGIDKKQHLRIFERFYRVQGKSEQTYPGFGIGLFIANEIVVRHEGHMNVESEKGKGSTFSFTLPIKTKANYR